jgi:hypothetical protein
MTISGRSMPSVCPRTRRPASAGNLASADVAASPSLHAEFAVMGAVCFSSFENDLSSIEGALSPCRY